MQLRRVICTSTATSARDLADPRIMISKKPVSLNASFSKFTTISTLIQMRPRKVIRTHKSTPYPRLQLVEEE
jgi:hypothetical protein